MLDIHDLKVAFADFTVLKGISISLAAGEKLAVIGESGAGKTTLAMAIMGLIEGGRCSGQIIFGGQDILSSTAAEMRGIRGSKLAMVPQDVGSALHPLFPVDRQVAEAILVHNRGAEALAKEKVKELFPRVGLSGAKTTAYPHQLSGGEKQKVLISMALANDPKVVIFDEPTSALDPITKRQTIEVLEDLLEDRTAVIISHDINCAAQLSCKTAVMYGGTVVETGPTHAIFSSPKHPYTRGLLRTYPDMQKNKDLQGIPGEQSHGARGCSFHPRCTQKIPICTAKAPELKDVGNRCLACHRGGIIPALKIKDLRQII